MSNAPINYEDKSFLCSVLDLINNGHLTDKTESSSHDVSYNIQLNQINATYFAVVVGKSVSELKVNFLYEPIKFDVPSPSSSSNTFLVVIIVVIVVLILLIVWIIVKGKRRNNITEVISNGSRPLI